MRRRFNGFTNAYNAIRRRVPGYKYKIPYHYIFSDAFIQVGNIIIIVIMNAL